MAAESLATAERRADRVAALTETVQAYEDGLSALRTAILAARTRETALRAELDARDDQLARILAVLASLQSAPETFLLLHPSGPLDTARAGMVASDVAPALQAEVAELTGLLEELQTLTAIRPGAAAQLSGALSGIEAARNALTHAISARPPPPAPRPPPPPHPPPRQRCPFSPSSAPPPPGNCAGVRWKLCNHVKLADNSTERLKNS